MVYWRNFIYIFAFASTPLRKDTGVFDSFGRFIGSKCHNYALYFCFLSTNIYICAHDFFPLIVVRSSHIFTSLGCISCMQITKDTSFLFYVLVNTFFSFNASLWLRLIVVFQYLSNQVGTVVTASLLKGLIQAKVARVLRLHDFLRQRFDTATGSQPSRCRVKSSLEHTIGLGSLLLLTHLLFDVRKMKGSSWFRRVGDV